jgi:hypothetical protein
MLLFLIAGGLEYAAAGIMMEWLWAYIVSIMAALITLSIAAKSG